MNLVLTRSSAIRSSLKLTEGFMSTVCAPRKYIPTNAFVNITSPCTSIGSTPKFYSDDRAHHNTRLPQLMEFPPLIWPSIIKFFKNWIFTNFIIKPYLDNDFDMDEFVEASKHAVQVVSGALERGDYKSLEGLMVKEALAELKKVVSTMSVSQRQMISVKKEDIFYAVPYQVGVMFDDSDKRFVEITMCYHVLLGYKSLKDSNDLPPIAFGSRPELEEKLFILNYRFIREFTKGVEDSWWINIVNHFQPHLLGK